MARGKKNCPKCSTELGARTQLCDCGWYFPEEKLREDLLKSKAAEEKDSSDPTYYDKEGRGRKRCPDCDKIVGGRLEKCYCGFDFVAAKENKDKEAADKKRDKKAAQGEGPAKEKMSPMTARILAELGPYKYVPPHIPTKREHAEEIFSRGVERASFMYEYAKRHKCWPHIDLDYLGELLGIKNKEPIPEEDKIVIGD